MAGLSCMGVALERDVDAGKSMGGSKEMAQPAEQAGDGKPPAQFHHAWALVPELECIAVGDAGPAVPPLITAVLGENLLHALVVAASVHLAVHERCQRG